MQLVNLMWPYSGWLLQQTNYCCIIALAAASLAVTQ